LALLSQPITSKAERLHFLFFSGTSDVIDPPRFRFDPCTDFTFRPDIGLAALLLGILDG
jgi:hypothetical protein